MSKDDQKWRGKTAVITGASSGIGAATARELARRGLRVVLVARRLERLTELASEIQQAGGQAQVITADLAQEGNYQPVYEQVCASAGEPDILVNNAGIGWYGYYADMPWETAQEMLRVNIASVMHLTRLFLPSMRRRNSGHIINIGSISGSIPSQGVALYSASKAFMDAFTTAIHRELSGSRVYISVVRAGPVASEFFQRVSHRPGSRSIPVERFAIPAERVAQRIWGLLRWPRRVIYVPDVLRVTPWVELLFGWIEDRIGPLLLRNQTKTVK